MLIFRNVCTHVNIQAGAPPPVGDGWRTDLNLQVGSHKVDGYVRVELSHELSEEQTNDWRRRQRIETKEWLQPAGSTGTDKLLPSLGSYGYGHKVLLSTRHCLRKYDIKYMLMGPVIFYPLVDQDQGPNVFGNLCQNQYVNLQFFVIRRQGSLEILQFSYRPSVQG